VKHVIRMNGAACSKILPAAEPGRCFVAALPAGSRTPRAAAGQKASGRPDGRGKSIAGAGWQQSEGRRAADETRKISINTAVWVLGRWIKDYICKVISSKKKRYMQSTKLPTC
jgi:hypothetical protein